MSCQIVLDNPGAYYPGDSVYGRVVCNFSSTQNFRGIRCKFRGRERTAWTDGESYYDRPSKSTKRRTAYYSGNNTFLSANLNLAGESTLSAGHYEYPFAFTFPRHNIPNPYNGNYGSISYYIKANVDIPLATDCEDEVTLHLISPINFNDISNELQMEPVAYQEEKTVCYCYCAGNPVTMNLALDKEAFVVGEIAKIKVEINNMSLESIQEINLSLEMTVESKTTSPSTSHKYNTDLIATKSVGGVAARGKRTYNIDFIIPQSTLVPNFAGCSLFKQWCVLKAEAVVPGCHTNLDMETGVKLGHIPLIGFVATATNIPANQAPGGAFSPPPVMAPYPRAYPADQKGPPYPTGPSAFPVPNGNDLGFSSDASAPLLPNKGMSVPVSVHGGPSTSADGAPLGYGGPSAPTKAQLAEEEGFNMVEDETKIDPPPPSYQDAIKLADFAASSAPPK